MQDDDGSPALHLLWPLNIAAALLSLYPEGVRVISVNMIHLFAHSEQARRGHPRRDIITTKLLVSAWPKSANIPNPDSPDIYNLSGRGAGRAAALLCACPA
jgi:hypothetical protein